MDRTLIKEWIRSLIDKEVYWFHKIELAPDLITPGWSDAAKDKLPYFGLPKNMEGMRVLDVVAAKGSFLLRRNDGEREKWSPSTLFLALLDDSIFVETGSGLTLRALRVVCTTSVRRPSVRSIWYSFSAYSITSVILSWLWNGFYLSARERY